jgi:thioester reductase-like protein
MTDLSQRIAALSPAKRELLAKRLASTGLRSAPLAGPPRPPRMTVEDMQAEAVLDPTIPRTRASSQAGPEPNCILLTGATGFVGAFLLAELLQQTRAQIVCLVRAPSAAQAMDRIKKNLEFYLIWDAAARARIVPLLGDLTQPALGLSGPEFDELAERVDAIYHCAALVKWTYPYQALKAANVQGTHEVLRLAGWSRLKPVHFVSTVGVFSSPDLSGSLVLEDDALERAAALQVGYAQSKWIAEKLVHAARARGMPATVYRPGVGGDSRTGVFNPHDHVYNLIKGCIQLGSAPDFELWLDLAPVDFVSRAVVHLSRQSASPGRNFHLVNRDALSWRDLIDYLNLAGYGVKLEPYPVWQSQLLTRVSGTNQNALYGLSPLIAELGGTGVQLPRFDCRNTLAGLAGTSIQCPPMDAELLATYFSFMLQSGFLDPP